MDNDSLKKLENGEYEYSMSFNEDEGIKCVFFENLSPLMRNHIDYIYEVSDRINAIYTNTISFRNGSVLFDPNEVNKFRNIDIYSFLNNNAQGFTDRIKDFTKEFNRYLSDMQYSCLEMSAFISFFTHINKFETMIFVVLDTIDTLIKDIHDKKILYGYVYSSAKFINNSMKQFLFAISTYFTAYYSAAGIKDLLKVKGSVIGTKKDIFKYIFLDPIFENKEKYKEIYDYCMADQKKIFKTLKKKNNRYLRKQKFLNILSREKLIIRKMFAPIGFNPFEQRKYAEKLVEDAENVKKIFVNQLESDIKNLNSVFDEFDKNTPYYMNLYIPEVDYKPEHPYFSEVLQILKTTNSEYRIEGFDKGRLSKMNFDFDSEIRKIIDGKMKKIKDDNPNKPFKDLIVEISENSYRLMINNTQFTNFLIKMESRLNNKFYGFLKAVTNTYYMLY